MEEYILKFESLKRPTIKEVFINKMESMILSGELPVGEKLPSERAMAEEMNISKTAVHDGLKDLERFGFVKSVPKQDVYKRQKTLSVSHLLIKTTSLIWNISGYFSGLSSPSGTDKIIAFLTLPVSNSAGQTRFPTFSSTTKSRSFAPISVTPCPVSYTHLDVYKRQPSASSPATPILRPPWQPMAM